MFPNFDFKHFPKCYQRYLFYNFCKHFRKKLLILINLIKVVWIQGIVVDIVKVSTFTI